MEPGTKELLDAHHAAILRELNGVSESLSSIRDDMTKDRALLSAHTESDSTRFGSLERGIGILQWAYGVGVAVIGLLLYKMGFRQ